MTKKPKESRHFEPVDWHHDHLGGKSSYSYGLGFITCRIQIGNCSFTVNHRLYMREKTVRWLNRSRPKEKRLKFRTKYSLARAMLLDLLSLIPKERKVYVLFAGLPSTVTNESCLSVRPRFLSLKRRFSQETSRFPSS